MQENQIENNTFLLGGFDGVAFEEDALINIIDVINELTEDEFEFVVQNSRHYTKKLKGVAK